MTRQTDREDADRSSEQAALRRARRDMVEQIERHFEDTRRTTGVSRPGDRLAQAMREVPRHLFVPPESAMHAYADTALPIGFRQTISQPFIVALMIELAHLRPDARVLEVGTGSGYQAAVLASLVREIHTIELVPELAERASRLLSELGLERVHVRCGDGFEGWPEAAPFDAILVTACSREVPDPLLAQLVVGGRMVLPLGAPNAYQELRVVEKTTEDSFEFLHGLPVAFVPLVHSDHPEETRGQ